MSPAGKDARSRVLGAVALEGRKAGVAAWLVGGAVRDRLLGREPVDLDVSLEGALADVARVVTALAHLGWKCQARHDRFGTATLRAPDGERLDVAATREETYPHPGSLPVVRAGAPILRDLARRDFTVHAMALPVEPDGRVGALVDPFGGEADVAGRRLRLLHRDSLADDPTRAFRATRYAARLGFGLDDGFGAAMSRAVASGAFARISGDRLRRAFQEVLSEENRDVAIELLERLAVPSAVVEGWEIGAAAARSLAGATGPDDAWRRLLAPAAPGLRERIATRLNFSRALRRIAGSDA